ncbi:MAG: DNA cytosine methyltransferase [Thiobacillus sp.]|uniref:DNA cytosine methyltransferase n=1 Tax=Thiobacillus sp. TaxID=924 RepID=UPI002894B444|nr:DNA cytosine methyltransferase [Thiobacillus sp.]MDT3706305.1 DNA cytosine methyltransferase [Thiobacillus sp.]
MKRTMKPKTSTHKRPTAIDLFSGCGGLSEGLKRAGFRVAAAVEIDPKALTTYRLNHPSVTLYENDIRQLDPEAVLADLGLERGELALLAGCPPCQGFSRLRTRNKAKSADDPRNDLVGDFLRFISVMYPKTIMMENVPALADDGRFARLCDSIKALGYSYVVNVLDAADYRVAQRRKRLILLASRVHEPKIAETRGDRLTVREALFGVGAPSATSDKLHALPERRSDAVRKLIAMIPKNGGSRTDLPVEYQLECHKKSNGFRDVYGRMAWDTVSPTITSGCINPSKGRFLHPSYNRTITLREASLLQGFPIDYRFDVSHGKEAIALMIGNALPPPFIAAHAKGLLLGINQSTLTIATRRSVTGGDE